MYIYVYIYIYIYMYEAPGMGEAGNELPSPPSSPLLAFSFQSPFTDYLVCKSSLGHSRYLAWARQRTSCPRPLRRSASTTH